MKKLFIILALLLCSANFVLAQSPVTTQPYNVTSYNSSGTIALTNTFQSIFAANTTTSGRAGCTVQNNSATNNMSVYFGPIANATANGSVLLKPGQATYCNIGGITLQDQVSITGTQNDVFFAAQQ